MKVVHAGVRIYWAEGMIVTMIAMNVILSFVDHCGVFGIVNASYEGLKADLLVICGLSGVLSEGMICTEYELSPCCYPLNLVNRAYQG